MVIRPNRIFKQVTKTTIRMSRNFWSKATLLKKFRHNVCNFIQIFPFNFTPFFAFFDVADRHRNHDSVSNKVAEIQCTFDFGFRRKHSIFLIVVINKFKDVSVKFFFGANQRLYSALKRKCQEGIFPRHKLIELFDSLRLRG